MTEKKPNSPAPCGRTEEHGPHEYLGPLSTGRAQPKRQCPGNLPETPKEEPGLELCKACQSLPNDNDDCLCADCRRFADAHHEEIDRLTKELEETKKRGMGAVADVLKERDEALHALHHHTDCNEAKRLKAENDGMVKNLSDALRVGTQAVLDRDAARAEVEIYRVVLADAVDHLMDGHDWEGSYGERTLLSSWLEAVWKAWHDQRPLKNPKDPDFMERLPSVTKREGP